MRPRSALAVGLVIVFFVPAAGAGSAPGAQELAPPPPKLVAGGTVFQKNDLQAWHDAMMLFRRFQREFNRIERFEVVDNEEDADFVVVLSGDLNYLGREDLVNRGIPWPSGYATSKVLFLVIHDARTKELLWLDAEDWDTSRNVTRIESHAKLVRRFKAALEDAG